MTQLYGLFQQLSVLLEPGLGLVHGSGLGPDNVPKPGRVVRFYQMGQFVDNHIVDNKHGRFDQAPVKVDVVRGGAGTPAVTGIHNLDLGWAYA